MAVFTLGALGRYMSMVLAEQFEHTKYPKEPTLELGTIPVPEYKVDLSLARIGKGRN